MKREATCAIQIPVETWRVYRPVVRALTGRNLPFAIAGGHALAAYTRRLRASKDLDLAVMPDDRESVIEVLLSYGFEDYYSYRAYDRKWIFRACREKAILDIIWAMPNQRAKVDAHWVYDGPLVRLQTALVRLIPPEELLWAKLYVLQYDRSDWPDLLNLIYAAGERLNWRHLLHRLGQDAALLSSLLVIFAWLRPERARLLPKWLWTELHLPRPGAWAIPDVKRESLLDTRDWFPAPETELRKAV